MLNGRRRSDGDVEVNVGVGGAQIDIFLQHANNKSNARRPRNNLPSPLPPSPYKAINDLIRQQQT